ncbi:collagen alpha-1(I) chain-like [Corvus cornix cornix]|uniref:collagen alpha-1(I) chain-like n=1 Tax=Corvus cornix cornix TaxID=932674 RepID=UPI0019525022|nr:collagen alpha-1(I) chain-like [Corvus cornix cornix]
MASHPNQIVFIHWCLTTKQWVLVFHLGLGWLQPLALPQAGGRRCPWRRGRPGPSAPRAAPAEGRAGRERPVLGRRQGCPAVCQGRASIPHLLLLVSLQQQQPRGNQGQALSFQQQWEPSWPGPGALAGTRAAVGQLLSWPALAAGQPGQRHSPSQPCPALGSSRGTAQPCARPAPGGQGGLCVQQQPAHRACSQRHIQLLLSVPSGAHGRSPGTRGGTFSCSSACPAGHTDAAPAQEEAHSAAPQAAQRGCPWAPPGLHSSLFPGTKALQADTQDLSSLVLLVANDSKRCLGSLREILEDAGSLQK